MNFKNLFDISICSNINRELWCKDFYSISDIDYFGLVGAVFDKSRQLLINKYLMCSDNDLL